MFRLLRETGPLWLIGLAAAVLKAVSGEAPATEFALPQRVLIVLGTFALNVRGIFLPVNLAARYNNLVPTSWLDVHVLGGLLALGACAAVLHRLRGQRLLVFGLAWFLVALAPSAQILPHHVFRADRFLYLPLIGVCVALGSGLCAGTRATGRPRYSFPAAALVVAALAIRTVLHAPVWRDAETVFTHNIASQRQSAIAHTNLGVAQMRRGKTAEAVRHLSLALQCKPDHATAHNNLGIIRVRQHRAAEGLRHFSRALAADADYAEAHFNAASVLLSLGRRKEAIRHYSEGARLAPEHRAVGQLNGFFRK
jgi:tetratricopeptide (TPR) repeat protein